MVAFETDPQRSHHHDAEVNFVHADLLRQRQHDRCQDYDVGRGFHDATGQPAKISAR